MRVLVLGAYGFIGLEVARKLSAAGHDIVGLGRSVAAARRLLPAIGWIEADLTTLQDAEDWLPHLAGFEAIVNAAGALQDGGRDDLVATQQRAIVALVEACEKAGIDRFVQISAPGADPAADTAFMRTKGMADQRLRDSALAWTILKPGLVIGANAYGGTALVRMLAGFPMIEILILGDRHIQTVALSDVCEAVLKAVDGDLPSKTPYDLVASDIHTLRDVVGRFRAWLGLPPPRASIALPDSAGSAVAGIADLAGRLGWRSPLRSTALKVLAQDIRGDAGPWLAATGQRLLSLDEMLAAMPSTRQERLFAKAQLVFPALVVTLSAFWLVSGLIGVWQREQAAALLPPWIPRPTQTALIIAGSIIDVAIGIALLLRHWLTPAALGSIAISVVYLAAGTLLKPELWADPLGPLVKILPAIALALAILALSDER